MPDIEAPTDTHSLPLRVRSFVGLDLATDLNENARLGAIDRLDAVVESVISERTPISRIQYTDTLRCIPCEDGLIIWKQGGFLSERILRLVMLQPRLVDRIYSCSKAYACTAAPDGQSRYASDSGTRLVLERALPVQKSIIDSSDLGTN